MKTIVCEWITVLVGMIALYVVLSLYGCSGWTYNGIRGDDLRKASGRDLATMGLGVAATYAVHTAGHVIAAEVMGKDWHYDGLSEIVDGELSRSEAQWFARAGFVSQLSVGYFAKAMDSDGPFWKGYNAGTAFEISTYPIMNRAANNNGDDIKMLDDNGGSGDVEWAAYTALSFGLNVGIADEVTK